MHTEGKCEWLFPGMGVPVSSGPAAGLDGDLIIGIQGRAGPGWQGRRGAAGSLQHSVCQSQLRQQQPHTNTTNITNTPPTSWTISTLVG